MAPVLWSFTPISLAFVTAVEGFAGSHCTMSLQLAAYVCGKAAMVPQAAGVKGHKVEAKVTDKAEKA